MIKFLKTFLKNSEILLLKELDKSQERLEIAISQKIGRRAYDGTGMLSDFFTFASVSISMIAKARQARGGNFSISSCSLSIRLTFRYRLGCSSVLWGGTRPLIIPFIAHRGPKEGCKRTRKRRSIVPPLVSPPFNRVPTLVPATTTALNAPSSMKQSGFPAARRRRLLNFSVPRHSFQRNLLLLHLRSIIKCFCLFPLFR